MTPSQLQSVTACSFSLAELFAEPLTQSMERWQINTPQRQAAFLAQIAHESGRLKFLREKWGPSEAQQRYETRYDLGNNQPGDGYKFRGRGLIQITGRTNYRRCGAALKLPLEDRPELLEVPIHAAMSAGWFWTQHGCNILADSGEFENITKVINGGLNGYADRLALWDKAKQAMEA